jgi:hypothetical protein
MLARQRGEGVADPELVGDALDLVLDARLGQRGLGTGYEPRPRGGAAQEVGGDALGDHEREAPHAGAPGVVAPGAAPEAHEGLLDELLGLAAIAQQPQPEPVDLARVGVVERAEGAVVVARGDQRQQLRVARAKGVLLDRCQPGCHHGVLRTTGRLGSLNESAARRVLHPQRQLQREPGETRTCDEQD